MPKPRQYKYFQVHMKHLRNICMTECALEWPESQEAFPSIAKSNSVGPE